MLKILLVLAFLLTSMVVLGEWQPIAAQAEPEPQLSLSYHALQSGGGIGGEDIFHQENDQCALYKVSFVQDLYFQVSNSRLLLF